MAIAATALVRRRWGGRRRSLSSCAQTPTNVPVQTFEQPQNMDVVCLQVFERDTNIEPIIPPIPQPQAQCAQVPVGVNGSQLPYHLFALVTQVTRGEVAVVDLTAGYVIDVDPFDARDQLPPGRPPSERHRGDPRRHHGVRRLGRSERAVDLRPPVRRSILGDSQEYDGGEINPNGTEPIPDLTTWPVCSLPQAPGAVRILPNNLLPPAGRRRGARRRSAAGYVIVAVLPRGLEHTAPRW